MNDTHVSKSDNAKAEFFEKESEKSLKHAVCPFFLKLPKESEIRGGGTCLRDADQASRLLNAQNASPVEKPRIVAFWTSPFPAGRISYWMNGWRNAH